MTDRQHLILVLLALSTFVLVLSLWVGGVLLYAARRSSKLQKVHRRLGLTRETVGERTLHLWLEGRELTTTVPSLARAGFVRRLEYQFHQAGWELSIAQILILVVGIVVITTAFMLVLTHNVIL